MVWSKNQQIALAVTPKISSLFSLFGSSWIIIEVATSRIKREHPYHRLLLAMSCYDVAESIGNFFSTWAIPNSEGNDDQVWAVGTTQTCTLQGFFLTFSVAVPIYNALLAFYYMLVVNHNVSDRTLRRVVEPFIHGIAFFWAFGTAFTSSVMGLINDANLWCWIAPFPSDCKDSWRFGEEGNCERGDNAWIYRWGFYFAPLWFCILFATVCTALVYRRVHALDQRTLRYRRPESLMDATSQPNADGRFFPNSRRRASFNRRRGPNRTANETDTDSLDIELEEQRDNDFLNGCDDNAIVVSLNVRQGFFSRWREQRKIYKEDYARSVEVSQQAIWYLGGLYVTHVWSTTNRIVQQIRVGETWFGLIFLHSWFDPFQGFLNYVVYQRPRYKKLRAANPDKHWLNLISEALKFSFVQNPKVLPRSPNNGQSSLPVIPASLSSTGSNTGSETRDAPSRIATGTFDDDGDKVGDTAAGLNGKILPAPGELEQLDEEGSILSETHIQVQNDLQEKDTYESLVERLAMFHEESLEI